MYVLLLSIGFGLLIHYSLVRPLLHRAGWV